MMATLLFHECPLIVMVTAGRLPAPSASTTSGGTSRPLRAPQARRRTGTSSSAPASSCQLAVQVLRRPAQANAACHANPSGPVTGPAPLPRMSRCHLVPPGQTPASLARARRPESTSLTDRAVANPAHLQPRLAATARPRSRQHRWLATPRRAGPFPGRCSRCSRCSHLGRRTNRRTRPTAASPRA
jgi:hypothetical protein